MSTSSTRWAKTYSGKFGAFLVHLRGLAILNSITKGVSEVRKLTDKVIQLSTDYSLVLCSPIEERSLQSRGLLLKKFSQRPKEDGAVDAAQRSVNSVQVEQVTPLTPDLSEAED